MKTILHSVDLKVGPEKVYRCLSTEKGLAGWWSTRVSADIKVGGKIHFKFIEIFNPVMEITELKENERVGWKCVDGHDPWNDNTFRFEIEERDSGSILFFRQEYAQELSDEEYGRYNFNWGYYLQSLKELAETGKGRPHSPDS